MDLNLKPEGTYTYDAASLGEVMLRLDREKEESVQHVPSVHGKAAENTTLSAVCVNASA